RPSQANSERPPPGTSSTSSMKGFGLSSTGSTTLPRPGSRRSAGALHPGTADELVLVPPRQTLNAFSGNVEHQLDEGFRVVEHRLDDTAPPKFRRSAGALHTGATRASDAGAVSFPTDARPH